MKHLLILFLISISTLAYNQGTYEIVVATNFDGQVVSGSIDDLIQEIRKGKAVRVGWQLDFNQDKKSDFDHWVPAEFITILNGHVFTQIPPIFAQGPNLDIPQVQIFSSPTQWTAVLGTNGKLLNRFITETPTNFDELEEAKQKQILKMKAVDSWKVATFWSVLK